MRALDRKLAEVWGEFRESPGDKQQLIAAWKTRLNPAALGEADKSQGRAVFNTACAPCHTLYGEGGKVGPDLTGGGRANLDYLLENIVDPSAVVTATLEPSALIFATGTLVALSLTQTAQAAVQMHFILVVEMVDGER